MGKKSQDLRGQFARRAQERALVRFHEALLSDPDLPFAAAMEAMRGDIPGGQGGLYQGMGLPLAKGLGVSARKILCFLEPGFLLEGHNELSEREGRYIDALLGGVAKGAKDSALDILKAISVCDRVFEEYGAQWDAHKAHDTAFQSDFIKAALEHGILADTPEEAGDLLGKLQKIAWECGEQQVYNVRSLPARVAPLSTPQGEAKQQSEYLQRMLRNPTVQKYIDALNNKVCSYDAGRDYYSDASLVIAVSPDMVEKLYPEVALSLERRAEKERADEDAVEITTRLCPVDVEAAGMIPSAELPQEAKQLAQVLHILEMAWDKQKKPKAPSNTLPTPSTGLLLPEKEAQELMFSARMTAEATMFGSSRGIR